MATIISSNYWTATAAASTSASMLALGDPMTPGTAEVVVLTTGAWYPGWKADTWTPIPRFEEQWALAKTSQERARLLAFYSPNASLTHYQRSILMSVDLPATKSDNPETELTFCDGTIRKRVCDFAYCVEDSEGDGGYWYCDACRNFANQQLQQDDDDGDDDSHSPCAQWEREI